MFTFLQVVNAAC